MSGEKPYPRFRPVERMREPTVEAEPPFAGRYFVIAHEGVTATFERTKHAFTKDGVTFIWWGMQPKEEGLPP